MDTREWYSGEVAAANWRRVMSRERATAFWAGFDWSHVKRDKSEEPQRWVNRPIGWAALAAFEALGVFPREALACATNIATDWLVAEHRSGRGGRCREAALPRWVRIHPGWIAKYREKAGEANRAKEEVAKWVVPAVEWLQNDSASWPVLEEAKWAIEPSLIKHSGVRLALAWREHWANVPTLVQSVRDLSPAWRVAFLGGCWLRIQELRRDETVPAAESRDFETLLLDEKPWAISFGAIGPFVRVAAAIALNRRHVAKRIWKTELRDFGARSMAGIGRFVKVAFPVPGELEAWLQKGARSEPGDGDALLVNLTTNWFLARRSELWGEDLAPSISRELALAIRLLALATKTPKTPSVALHFYARLVSFAGLDDRIFAAIDRFVQSNDGQPAELPAAIGVILWRRGMVETGSRVLERWGLDVHAGGFPTFLWAVSAHFLGQHDRAAAALARLRANAPGFLEMQDVIDARWALAAMVFRASGQEGDAKRMREIAAKVPGSSQQFIELLDTMPSGQLKLAPEWRELFTV
jgi:hypothetical protein